MTRYHWALELDVAISAIWLSTALNSIISYTKNKGYKGHRISFKISLCIKQRGMRESFMIKQRGFVCFNLQINYSRENIDFQCLCSLVHKSVTSILIYQFISCIRR